MILFLLPPRWGYDRERLEGLVDVLDRQEIIPGLRSALEVRDRSWYNESLFEVLREHDSPWCWPTSRVLLRMGR